jgi:hypothetical protein
MTTSLVVERSEPGYGLPPALSFKDVHHPCWGGGRAELGSRLPHGLAARFFLQHSREKGVRYPCEGGKLRVHGAGRLRCRQLPRAWLFVLGGLVPPPALPLAAWTGRGCSSTARVMVVSCTGRPHPRLPPRAGRTGGTYKTSYAAGAAATFLDGLVLTPAVRTGARTSSRALGPPPFAGTALVRRWPLSSVLRWSPPLVRLPTAEVVASASETVSATYHRALDSLALMASLPPPVGRRGRGPFRSGARAEAVATAGESLGAEVVVAAGAEVVAVADDPSMQRWSPPLVRLLGASFQRDSCWCSVVHSCRNGARAPL